jgi:hypothetical protein
MAAGMYHFLLNSCYSLRLLSLVVWQPVTGAQARAATTTAATGRLRTADTLTIRSSAFAGGLARCHAAYSREGGYIHLEFYMYGKSLSRSSEMVHREFDEILNCDMDTM